MKNNSKKFLSTLLILSFVFTSAVLALTTTLGYADPPTFTTSLTSSAKSGIPGSVVTHTFKITNNTSDPIDLSISGTSVFGWGVSNIPYPTGSLTIQPGENTVSVYVSVPSSATTGQDDVATIIFADALVDSATVTLRTTASSPVVSGRPLLAVHSYNTGLASIRAGAEFNLELRLDNVGQVNAQNVIVTFSGTGFYPRSTGGVQSTERISAGSNATFTQTFLVGDELMWANISTITASVSYIDPSGSAFTDTFSLSIGIKEPAYNGAAATATPQTTLKPQLVIVGNKTDIDPLQPGSIFELDLDVKNLGTSDAKAVTMVLGGGVSSGNDSGTPQPGGVSGSAGDLTNFAPLGSSNVVVVGDIKQGESVSVKQKLVVNVTTAPGAYTLKISFVYADPKGTRFVDDQVITLLVYSLPQVEVSFYRDPGMMTVGMSNMLPLQVTNLGKKSSVLGNMKVTAQNADVVNNVALVGALEPGGYFTLDSELIPMQEGSLDVEISINYTDDFNQTRFITQTITVEVLPAPVIDPGMEGTNGGELPVVTAPETFWSKVLRFFKGLLGLDSGVKQPIAPDGGEVAPTDFSKPIIVPKG